MSCTRQSAAGKILFSRLLKKGTECFERSQHEWNSLNHFKLFPPVLSPSKDSEGVGLMRCPQCQAENRRGAKCGRLPARVVGARLRLSFCVLK